MKKHLKNLFFILFLLIIAFPSSVIAKERPEKITASFGAISGNQSILTIIKESRVFERNALGVTLVFIAGSSIVPLLAGEVNFAMTGGPPAMRAILEGADVVGILSITSSLSYIIVSSRDVQKPEDLKGKRIAISRFGTSADLGARIGLKKMGLIPVKDVAILQIGSQPDRFAALSTGAVSAAVVDPAWENWAKERGFNILADLSTIEFPSTFVSTTRLFVKNRPDVVKKFTKSYIEGIHFLRTSKEKSKRILARFLKLKEKDEETIEAFYLEAVKRLAVVPYPTLKGIQDVLVLMAETNPKAKNARPEDFVDMRFIRELDESGFIKKLYER